MCSRVTWAVEEAPKEVPKVQVVAPMEAQMVQMVAPMEAPKVQMVAPMEAQKVQMVAPMEAQQWVQTEAVVRLLVRCASKRSKLALA